MICNYLRLCLFIVSACFSGGTVAREAIIGGGRASTNQFPYQVSVQIRGHGHVCGGGIIAEKYVLTAAHCVLDRMRRVRSTHIYVLAGTKNISRTGPPALTVRVEKIFFPSEFHPTAVFNSGDIAVLRLVDFLRLEQHRSLGKLELPRNYDHGSTALISGFGWSEFNNGVGSTDGRLRYAWVDVLPNEECEQRYPYGAIQSDMHLCASARYIIINYSMSVCMGDDGSPLVSPNAKTIIGILSRIPPHCNGNYETPIYTRVAHYVMMIFNIMERGHDPSMISLNV